jgi:UPF0755 protein
LKWLANKLKALPRSVQALLLLTALGSLYLVAVWHWPLRLTGNIHTVQPGSSMRAVSRQLYQQGVLPDGFSLRLLARLTGTSGKIKAGEYRFEPGMSQREILTAMVDGDQVRYSVLLVEGTTFADFLQTLARHEKLEHTLEDMSPEQIMDRLSYGNQHPEGRFFPDTYTFSAGTKDLDVLRQAYKKMEYELQREWGHRDTDLPYKNSYEALIMASIIEKETGRPEDRERIAAVFVNRLRRNMKLQTDPTVIYGLGSRFDGNLRKRDLQQDTPYNTYTRRGLPPTPISSPGLESLRAALHPAQTNDLYFVARGDGSSEFSETYREHNNAVRKYQLGGSKKNKNL